MSPNHQPAVEVRKGARKAGFRGYVSQRSWTKWAPSSEELEELDPRGGRPTVPCPFFLFFSLGCVKVEATSGRLAWSGCLLRVRGLRCGVEMEKLRGRARPRRRDGRGSECLLLERLFLFFFLFSSKGVESCAGF